MWKEVFLILGVALLVCTTADDADVTLGEGEGNNNYQIVNIEWIGQAGREGEGGMGSGEGGMGSGEGGMGEGGMGEGGMGSGGMGSGEGEIGSGEEGLLSQSTVYCRKNGNPRFFCSDFQGVKRNGSHRRPL